MNDETTIQTKEQLASTIATAVLAQGYDKDALIEIAILIAAVESACAQKPVKELTDAIELMYTRALEEKDTMEYLRKLDQAKFHPVNKTKH